MKLDWDEESENSCIHRSVKFINIGSQNLFKVLYLCVKNIYYRRRMGKLSLWVFLEFTYLRVCFV